MISVEEARERILSYCAVLPSEERQVLDAIGQVIAEDIVSEIDIPPLDNTAMDGYAVRAADTSGATEAAPVTLRVIGELAAGYLFDGELQPGTAVRIMTGAPMPRGADAVVPFEETDEPQGRAFGAFAKSRDIVGVLKAAEPRANVRDAAEDVHRGQRIIRAGAVLHAAQCGVLASLGRATMRVHRRPVVAVLSTGDEVREPGQSLQPGQIYDSNAYSISAMVLEAGGIPKRLGIAKDTVEALTAKLREGLDADMLVTSAGVSRGDYDVVKDVLAKEGEVDFWTVRMRPGKPLAFGAFPSGGRRVPHIGLPGNPVSSMV
ncbi:MAG TPA: gephyrin-like molybdotransferase Glp, partial [Dehalococcoidia bacterium]